MLLEVSSGEIKSFMRCTLLASPSAVRTMKMPGFLINDVPRSMNLSGSKDQHRRLQYTIYMSLFSTSGILYEPCGTLLCLLNKAIKSAFVQHITGSIFHLVNYLNDYLIKSMHCFSVNNIHTTVLITYRSTSILHAGISNSTFTHEYSESKAYPYFTSVLFYIHALSFYSQSPSECIQITGA